MAGVPAPHDAHAVAGREPRLPRLPERLHRRDRGAVPLRLLRVEPPGRRLAGAQPLDPRVHLAGRDRPLPQQPLLGAPQPALVVGGTEVVLGIHLLPDRASAPPADPLDADERRHRERPPLPGLVVDGIGAGNDDRAEAVHATHVVNAVDGSHDIAGSHRRPDGEGLRGVAQRLELAARPPRVPPRAPT